jgi:hypothetical protein
MAGYVMKMNILVSNINQCGQEDLSSEVRHKAYARPLCTIYQKRELMDFSKKGTVKLRKE